MLEINRRALLATWASSFAVKQLQAAGPAAIPRIGFGFGTYAMKGLPVSEALRTCAEIGYDGVELALLKGWSTEPNLLSKNDRRQIRQQFTELGLELPSLLESLPCLRTDAEHQTNLEKLKRATELAHDLAPQQPPVVQSIVSGKPTQWDQTKQRLVEQLSDWAEIGRASGTVICFKPHAGHAVHTPDRALWVHQQVNSPWLKVVYDYSHFYLQGLSLGESLEQSLPVTAYIQIKDSQGTPEKHDYLLPGDGATDYIELFTKLKQARYQGFVNVEVSSHIHRQKGYDPLSTAKLCYQRIAPIFQDLGIRRRV